MANNLYALVLCFFGAFFALGCHGTTESKSHVNRSGFRYTSGSYAVGFEMLSQEEKRLDSAIVTVNVRDFAMYHHGLVVSVFSERQSLIRKIRVDSLGSQIVLPQGKYIFQACRGNFDELTGYIEDDLNFNGCVTATFKLFAEESVRLNFSLGIFGVI